MSDTREIEYWSVGEQERLSHETIDEAVEWFLDGVGGGTEGLRPFLASTIEVIGYARMEPGIEFLKSALLERALEALDEEYAGPDGDYSEATEAMKAAEEVFIQAILAEYTPWTCEQVCTRKVNVEEWVKEHQPGWLAELEACGKRLEAGGDQ